MMSLTETFSAAELRRVNATMDYVYDQFVDRVAAGRGLRKGGSERDRPRPRLDRAQASENGLVDELGGLFAAINAAKTAIGIAADEKVELVFYPQRRNLFQRIGQLFGTQLFGSAPLWWQHLRGVTAAWNFPSGSILALMPQDVSIR